MKIRMSIFDESLQNILTPDSLIRKPVAWRLGAATAIALLAVVIRYLLVPVIGIMAPYNITLIGMVLATMFLGLIPGLLVLVLSNITVELIIIVPAENGFTVHSAESLIFSLAVGVIVCYLFHSLRKSRDRARALGTRELDEIEALKKAEQALKQSEEQFRMLVGKVDSALALVDENGRFAVVNQSFLDMFEIAEGTDIMNINNHDWSLYKVLDESRALLPFDEHPVREAMLTGKAVRDRLVGLICPGSRNLKWILITADPLLNDHGKLLHLICTYHEITDRKLAEETLREREEQMRFALSISHTGAWELDLANHRALRSLEHDRIFGYNEMLPEWTFEMFLEHVLPEDREMVGNKFRTAIESNSEWNFECRIKRKDNEIRWIWAAGRQYTGPARSPGHMSGIVQDITERINREAELRRKQTEIQAMFDYLPAGLVLFDAAPPYRVLAHNTFYQKLFPEPFRSGGMVGLNIYEYAPEVEASGIKAVFDKVVQTKETTFLLDFPYRSNPPDEYWFDWYMVPVIIDGKVISMASMSVNVTERHLAEQKINQSKEKLNIALENGNIGIWEWNLKTDEIFLDERMEKMLGLEPATFGGTFDDLEKLVHEEDVTHVLKASEDALTKGIPFDTIFRLRSKNGNPKYLKSKALVVKDEDGNPLKFSGVCIDVTGLKEGTEHLSLKLNEELLRSNKELERFAYVASHDLQEPLRMVSSFTQLLQQRYAGKLDRNAMEYIQFAVDGARRMHDQINGLLEYSRIQTRGRSFSKVSMNHVVEKVRFTFEGQLKSKNLKLEAGTLPEVVADEMQMIQLLHNLLGNSIKFSGRNKKIKIACEVRDEKYLFSVTDEGIGIEEQYFEKIFEIFQRLNPKDEYEGTGIGLAICKRIVERHGGEITVSSRIGEGSTFFFTLPVNRQA